MEKDGVIKFTCDWRREQLAYLPGLAELIDARQRLFDSGLIGSDGDGIGFGNISLRLPASPQFLISASGTGGLPLLKAEHIARVAVVDLQKNYIKCFGERPASSESMTHAALYQADPKITAVVHVHDRALWDLQINNLPTTCPTAAYGTPEMAFEVLRLYRLAGRHARGVFVMGGHIEGLLAFDRSAGSAAAAVLRQKHG